MTRQVAFLCVGALAIKGSACFFSYRAKYVLEPFRIEKSEPLIIRKNKASRKEDATGMFLHEAFCKNRAHPVLIGSSFAASSSSHFTMASYT